MLKHNSATATIELIQNKKGYNRHASTEKQRTSIRWDMLMRLYELMEEGNSPVLVTVDKEYMVQTVQPDVTNWHTCTSTYHQGDRLVPLSEFGQSKGGIGRAGTLRKACNTCVERRKVYDAQAKIRAQEIALAIKEDRTSVKTESNGTSESEALPSRDYTHSEAVDRGLPSWKIEVIERRTHFVYAADYLDAASQFDGKGEIVKIEKV